MTFAALRSFRRDRSRKADKTSVRAALSRAIEPLEPRRLMSVVLGNTLGNTFGSAATGATTVNLAGTFDDTAIEGTAVRIVTSAGNIDLELFDKEALKTAQNFVNYVANGLYDNTVIHRSAPGFLIQGGGYDSAGKHIDVGPSIAKEATATQSNLRGTIAMGAGIANGAATNVTSEWFVNLANNGASLDAGNTVFGQVINGTMDTVDAIAGLPVIDASAVAPPFGELPVRNIPSGAPTTNDFVFVDSASVVDDTKFLSISRHQQQPGCGHADRDRRRADAELWRDDRVGRHHPDRQRRGRQQRLAIVRRR